MKTVVRIAALICLLLSCLALASAAVVRLPLRLEEDTKETGAFAPAQEAADHIKDFAKADGAFLAAGLIKDGFKKAETLDHLLLYPQDEVLVLKLTGAQIKSALERSVSLYPQPNTSFLQLGGIEASFSKSAAPGSRITSAKIDGNAIEPNKSYRIAMPASLGRGGLGYFKIWDSPNIEKTYTQTVESVLKGKLSSGSASRWSVSD